MRSVLFAMLVLMPLLAEAQSPPPCAAPAPLIGPASCAPVPYIVVFKDGVSVLDVTHALEAKYGFTAALIVEAERRFFGTLTAQQVALLRCEVQVAAIERNLGPTCLPFGPCPPPPDPSGPCPAPGAEIPLFGLTTRIGYVVALGLILFLTIRHNGS